jgi:hypothetical protein
MTIFFLQPGQSILPGMPAFYFTEFAVPGHITRCDKYDNCNQNEQFERHFPHPFPDPVDRGGVHLYGCNFHACILKVTARNI